MRLLLWVMAALVTLGLGGGVLTFLHPRPFTEVDAGRADEYAVGTVRHFRIVPGREAGTLVQPVVEMDDATVPAVCGVVGARRFSGFFVVRRVDGFVVFADRNTYSWGGGLLYRFQRTWPVFTSYGNYMSSLPANIDTRVFTDPCGDGTFTADNGDPLFGPACCPLDLLPVRLRNGRVRVGVNLNPYLTTHRQLHQPAPAVPA